jgi:hypothetical protein
MRIKTKQSFYNDHINDMVWTGHVERMGKTRYKMRTFYSENQKRRNNTEDKDIDKNKILKYI